jgi:hypothetical protein
MEIVIVVYKKSLKKHLFERYRNYYYRYKIILGL